MMDITLLGGSLARDSHSLVTHHRLLLAFVVVAATVLSESGVSHLGYFLMALLFWKQSSMGLRAGLKRLLLIDSVIILAVLPLPFSFVGNEAVTVGSLELSVFGLAKAQDIFIKSTVSSIVMISQCHGISGLELSKALARLKVPGKFILLLQFCIRYVSVMQQEITSLRTAMLARGFGNGPTLHNWRSYGYLFGMLLVRALARADRIWFAMKCRGYKGQFPATLYQDKKAAFSWQLTGYFLLTTAIFYADFLGPYIYQFFLAGGAL
ncbi:energy-coupling factor transporter transmembrane protein EcfT [Photobacterium sp. OFAV2-7]|uniref:energy-coupling factor transporter transmembrane component T family protein n=1 Tax=Photobacterium sp. OFAV2-7 TaxID=2917748 RepID=UPI001EF5ADEC|nr:energy-coupling factor transporter transmembrane component T [Photobacterium sp. OFAV2-7]MCG7587194.1 energy-coupling factor transporter transmembrane protein EcfT [Photobacterium sp. OFAV2-7]